MSEQKTILLGLRPDEIKSVAISLGLPAFAGKQIAEWIYVRHAKSFDEMTNLSKVNREKLAAACDTGYRAPIDRQCSADGTVKYLFPAGDGDDDKRFVETVYIPDGKRATLCVSSQVGCRMNCLFCQTGKQGFDGNLAVHGILNQVYALPEAETLTNIVFMGQGEPLDNLDAVLRATEILTAPYGMAWSPKRITISTVGVKAGLKRLLNESECHVAVSLHSPFHAQRVELMPAERAMPIEDTIAMLSEADFTHQRRISFEYIVFDGVNDSVEHAQGIVKLLKPLDKALGGKWNSQCRVNLIRFHQIPNVPLQGANERKMEQMRDYLNHHGITTTIRASRGQDIQAACGLLSTDKKRLMEKAENEE